ncbi:MAG: GntR family transcriptional regulator [Treponema sp.]|nr:GntR family transcriptional regulator [Treponema sp.]MBR5033570.1 GntR family transcriptional regulator [Treponema sp.]
MKNIEKLPKESNRDYAFRVIRDNIISLELKPGTMISEQDLAYELDLSRTPVHEALQELSKTKIVEIFPQKGSLVSLINLELVNEAVFVRATLESAITEEACKIANDEDIKYLTENVELQEFLLKQNNIDKFMEMDNLFHQKMYEITNKMQCYYMVKSMNIHHDRFRALRVHGADRTPILKVHKQILQAIQDKDAEAARELTAEHINRTRLDAAEIQKKYPQYFA